MLWDLTERGRSYIGKCIDCGSSLELYEINLERGTKVLQCQQCSLFHYYKKGLLGRWKLVKATKVFDLSKK